VRFPRRRLYPPRRTRRALRPSRRSILRRVIKLTTCSGVAGPPPSSHVAAGRLVWCLDAFGVLYGPLHAVLRLPPSPRRCQGQHHRSSRRLTTRINRRSTSWSPAPNSVARYFTGQRSPGQCDACSPQRPSRSSGRRGPVPGPKLVGKGVALTSYKPAIASPHGIIHLRAGSPPFLVARKASAAGICRSCGSQRGAYSTTILTRSRGFSAALGSRPFNTWKRST
jgi:hypothetical protein